MPYTPCALCTHTAFMRKQCLADPRPEQRYLHVGNGQVLRFLQAEAVERTCHSMTLAGLVVARTPAGDWSAPCAVSAAGMGWGLQLGGELADVLLVSIARHYFPMHIE